MLHNQKVALNYASALYNGINDLKENIEILDQLDELIAILKAGELMNLLISQVTSFELKKQILDQVAQRTNLSTPILKLLPILLANKRFDYLDDIRDQYENILLEKQGVIKAEVVSARVLSKSDIAQIMKIIESKSGKKVKINAVVDENLIGGAVIKFGSNFLDCSLSGSLKNLTKITSQAELV